MRPFISLCCLLSVASAGIAQKKAPDPKAYAATITQADLRTLLFDIAGKEMEGRETATEGQRKAATYLEARFRQLGLKPGFGEAYQMPFPVYRDSLIGSHIDVNGRRYALNTDFTAGLQPNMNATQYFSEVVVAGHGIVDSARNDYEGLDVRGKAVLLLPGAPGNAGGRPGARNAGNYFAKVNRAVEAGAAAVLIVGNGFPRPDNNTPGGMYNELFRSTQMPNVYIVSERLAGDIIGAGWKELRETASRQRVAAQKVAVELELEYARKTISMQSTNVLGILEGGERKDEWLVLTAHYDHLGKRGETIYYGADDDGSGTVAVLEIAEAFAKAKAEGKGPARSILFMLVSGEEKGLWGSEYYSDHPTIALEKVTANLNIDMIGRVDTERNSADTLNYVYVVGDDKLSTELKTLSEGVNARTTRLSLDYKFNDPNDVNRIFFRSDHYNFARKGVPIIFYYDGMLKSDYHRPTDTPDKIHYPLLEKRARLVFHTAWEMTNREALLKRDLPQPTM